MTLRERWRVARRKRELEYLINNSRYTTVAWHQELAHIRRTGRLDWVDPNPIKIHPAGTTFRPPSPAPR